MYLDFNKMYPSVESRPSLFMLQLGDLLYIKIYLTCLISTIERLRPASLLHCQVLRTQEFV